MAEKADQRARLGEGDVAGGDQDIAGEQLAAGRRVVGDGEHHEAYGLGDLARGLARQLDGLHAGAEPAAGDLAMGQELGHATIDGGGRNHQHLLMRAEGGHAEQPTARVDHRTAFGGLTQAHIQADELVDATTTLALPAGAQSLDDAQASADTTDAVGTKGEHQASNCLGRGAFDGRGDGVQAQGCDVGAAIASGGRGRHTGTAGQDGSGGLDLRQALLGGDDHAVNPQHGGDHLPCAPFQADGERLGGARMLGDGIGQ